MSKVDVRFRLAAALLLLVVMAGCGQPGVSVVELGGEAFYDTGSGQGFGLMMFRNDVAFIGRVESIRDVTPELVIDHSVTGPGYAEAAGPTPAPHAVGVDQPVASVVQLRATQVFAGGLRPGQVVEVFKPGGRLGSMVYQNPESPFPKEGQDYLVFGSRYAGVPWLDVAPWQLFEVVKGGFRVMHPQWDTLPVSQMLRSRTSAELAELIRRGVAEAAAARAAGRSPRSAYEVDELAGIAPSLPLSGPAGFR